MGRGDKKTKRGKIAAGSFGKHRANKPYKNPPTLKDGAKKKTKEEAPKEEA